MSQKEWTVAEAVTSLCAGSLLKGVISNPKGETPWKKVNFRRLEDSYQIEKFTQKQAFHSHCDTAGLEKEIADLLAMGFRQVDAWSENTAFSLKISKKGKVTLLKKAQTTQTQRSHNREKQYLLKEDTNIPPLIDLGVFTKEGKVVQSMYGKFRQINRFTELIRDGLEEL